MFRRGLPPPTMESLFSDRRPLLDRTPSRDSEKVDKRVSNSSSVPRASESRISEGRASESRASEGRASESRPSEIRSEGHARITVHDKNSRDITRFRSESAASDSTRSYRRSEHSMSNAESSMQSHSTQSTQSTHSVHSTRSDTSRVTFHARESDLVKSISDIGASRDTTRCERISEASESTESTEPSDDVGARRSRGRRKLHSNEDRLKVLREKLECGEGITQGDLIDVIVDTILGAADVAAECLKPAAKGHSTTHILYKRMQEVMNSMKTKNATFVVLGPPMGGKTSFTQALIGCPMRPSDCADPTPCDFWPHYWHVPTRITTRWKHVVWRTTPLLRISDPLYDLLRRWARTVLPAHVLQQEVECLERVSACLALCQRIVALGCLKELIDVDDLASLCDLSYVIDIECVFASLSCCDPDTTGTISIIDLPSPQQPFLHTDVTRLYRSALQQCHGLFLLVDASRAAVPLDTFVELVDECLESKTLAREDVWVIGNCIDKILGFYCGDGAADVCEQVMVDQFARWSSIILDERHVLPTAAKLSRLSLYGRRKVADLFCNRRSVLGKKVIEDKQHEAWFSDVAHFAYGSEWQKSMRMVQSKWDEALDAMRLAGRVTNELSREVLEVAHQQSRRALCLTSLNEFLDHFLSHGRGHSPLTLVEVEKAVDFGVLFDSINLQALELARTCAPQDDDVSVTVSVQRLSLMFTPRDKHHFHPMEGMRVDATDNDALIPIFLRVARESVGSWDRKLIVGVEGLKRQVKDGVAKWEDVFRDIFRDRRVDAATQQRLLPTVKAISLPSTANLSAFPEKLLVESCTEFASNLKCETKKQLIGRPRTTVTLAPPLMQQFIVKLGSEWAANAADTMHDTVLSPLEAHFDTMVDIVDAINAADGVPVDGEQQFDFSFIELAQVLPPLAAISVDAPLSEDEIMKHIKTCELVQEKATQIAKSRGIL